MMCVSPYPHRGQGTNSCLYWLGKYRDGRFNLDSADGAATAMTIHPKRRAAVKFCGAFALPGSSVVLTAHLQGVFDDHQVL